MDVGVRQANGEIVTYEGVEVDVQHGVLALRKTGHLLVAFAPGAWLEVWDNE